MWYVLNKIRKWGSYSSAWYQITLPARGNVPGCGLLIVGIMFSYFVNLASWNIPRCGILRAATIGVSKTRRGERSKMRVLGGKYWQVNRTRRKEHSEMRVFRFMFRNSIMTCGQSPHGGTFPPAGIGTWHETRGWERSLPRVVTMNGTSHQIPAWRNVPSCGNWYLAWNPRLGTFPPAGFDWHISVIVTTRGRERSQPRVFGDMTPTSPFLTTNFTSPLVQNTNMIHSNFHRKSKFLFNLFALCSSTPFQMHINTITLNVVEIHSFITFLFKFSF